MSRVNPTLGPRGHVTLPSEPVSTGLWAFVPLRDWWGCWRSYKAVLACSWYTPINPDHPWTHSVPKTNLGTLGWAGCFLWGHSLLNTQVLGRRGWRRDLSY